MMHEMVILPLVLAIGILIILLPPALAGMHAAIKRIEDYPPVTWIDAWWDYWVEWDTN